MKSVSLARGRSLWFSGFIRLIIRDWCPKSCSTRPLFLAGSAWRAGNQSLCSNDSAPWQGEPWKIRYCHPLSSFLSFGSLGFESSSSSLECILRKPYMHPASSPSLCLFFCSCCSLFSRMSAYSSMFVCVVSLGAEWEEEGESEFGENDEDWDVYRQLEKGKVRNSFILRFSHLLSPRLSLPVPALFFLSTREVMKTGMCTDNLKTARPELTHSPLSSFLHPSVSSSVCALFFPSLREMMVTGMCPSENPELLDKK